MEVLLHKNTIKETSCSCEHKKKGVCSHMVAFFFAIDTKKQQEAIKEKKGTKGKKDTLKSLFEKISRAELEEFIKTYSLLLAGVFQLKGSDTSTQEKLFATLDKVVQQVTKAIRELNPKLLEEGSLWEQFIYMIEDGWFSTAYHEIFYIKEGRRSL